MKARVSRCHSVSWRLSQHVQKKTWRHGSLYSLCNPEDIYLAALRFALDLRVLRLDVDFSSVAALAERCVRRSSSDIGTLSLAVVTTAFLDKLLRSAAMRSITFALPASASTSSNPRW